MCETNPETIHVYIDNLNPEFMVEDLNVMFQTVGNVISCKVNGANKLKIYGVVSFSKLVSAIESINKFNMTLVHGKLIQMVLDIDNSIGEEAIIERNLYIKNLDPSVTDETLSKTFSQFGTIVSAKIMKSPYGKSRGFGFVCFETFVEARKAITSLNGQELFGKKIYVGPAQKKEERQSCLKEKFKDNFRPVDMPVENGIQKKEVLKELLQISVERLYSDLSARVLSKLATQKEDEISKMLTNDEFLKNQAAVAHLEVCKDLSL